MQGKAEDIMGVTVSCVDMAMPCMFVSAAALGMTGYETKEQLDGNRALVAKLQELRVIAGERMGLGDVTEKVIPKPVLVAASEGWRYSVRALFHAIYNCYRIRGYRRHEHGGDELHSRYRRA